MPHADKRERITPVRQAAAYELVVDQIRRAIQIGRFLPGEKLPPERELAKQLNVSRTTVREAARVLEGEGLVQTRRGATGGLVVLSQKLSDAGARELLKTNLQELEQIFDFRIANETAAARLAAVRRTGPQLAEIRKLYEEMDDLISGPARNDVDTVAKFRAADSAFHLAIAEASGNELLMRAVEDAHSVVFRPIGTVFHGMDDHANDYHEAILRAIEARDPDEAARSVEAHIEATRSRMREIIRPRARTAARPRKR